jgi:hypothetical protein
MSVSKCGNDAWRAAYTDDNPEEPGVMCLRMELSLSPAIVKRFVPVKCKNELVVMDRSDGCF